MPLPQFPHLLWSQCGEEGNCPPSLLAQHCGDLLPWPPAPCFAHFFPYWSLAQAWDAEGVAAFSLHRTGGVGGDPSLPFNLFLEEF